MACGYAMGAFGAGMRVHAWVPIINAGVITLILGINRLWGFAGTGLAFGVAGGSVISVSASELFMGGDPAMGVVIAVMAVGIVLGMLQWRPVLESDSGNRRQPPTPTGKPRREQGRLGRPTVNRARGRLEASRSGLYGILGLYIPVPDMRRPWWC